LFSIFHYVTFGVSQHNCCTFDSKRLTVCVMPLRGTLGRAAGRCPTEKMLRCRKLLEICADRASELPASIAQPERIGARQSPASGARFVGRFFFFFRMSVFINLSIVLIIPFAFLGFPKAN
jgi:hypothetical protein